MEERTTDQEMMEEEEYDYYVERPNDLRRLSDMEDWQVVEGEPDVRGWAVVNQNGDQIGTIDDLMVSEEAGAAIMALVSYGGFWGMGTSQTLVPIDWLELNLDRNQALFLGTDEDLKDAPKYTADERDFGRYYDHWSEREPEWMTGGEEEMEVTDLTGWKVLDEHGHEIGEVRDLTSDDRGALVVVRYGEYWGISEKQTLVPLDNLMADEENQRLVLDMTADHLKSAPEYTGQAEDYGPWYDYWGVQRHAA
mgnify:CR=1 FL=1